MKNLFICTTPLHSLIAGKIILANAYRPEECALLFFSPGENQKRRFYFERLATMCGESTFHVISGRYPGNLWRARQLLRGRRFDRVFFAGIGNPYIQVTLSAIDVAEINTFDDGTTNISPTSVYTQRFGISPLRLLNSLLVGNRYPQSRIKSQAHRHYTIFRDFQNNALAPLTWLNLIDPPDSAGSGRRCSLILGTVFSDVFGHHPAADLGQRLARFAQGLSGEVFYLPHPRGEPVPALAGLQIESNLVAEHIVMDLLKVYAGIDLYGFGSCSQFVFLSEPRISHCFLYTEAMKPAFRELLDQATNSASIRTLAL